jgi:hypothetical protein
MRRGVPPSGGRTPLLARDAASNLQFAPSPDAWREIFFKNGIAFPALFPSVPDPPFGGPHANQQTVLYQLWQHPMVKKFESA